MYPEFIAIYVGLGVVLVLLLVILALVIVTLSKIKRLGAGTPSYYAGNNTSVNGHNRIVFCKKCAVEFDVAEKFCPKCGTPR